MLAYILALLIGLGSLALYMAAFFFPEVHRKNDFIWSGVGLFYALVLWVCAGRITGGVLLGQMASVALLGWFGWQTLTLRRLLVSPDQQTEIPSQDELQAKLQNSPVGGFLQGLQQQLTGLFRKGKSQAQTAQTQIQSAVTETGVDKKIDSVASKVSTAVTDLKETSTTPTATPPAADTQPKVEAAVAPVEEDLTVDDDITEAIDTRATVEVPTKPEQEPGVEDATETEIPELVRPNPPDPELIEAAQKSASPDIVEQRIEATTQEAETAAGIDLAPPAEPPGSGDPEDRQAIQDAPATIEAVPIDPENPPTAT